MTNTSFDIATLGREGNPVVEFPNGGVIFIKGDRGACAYVVKTGRVEIREAGRVVETIEPGEMFGEMALVDAEPRSASAVAVSPVELVAIDHPTFDNLVHEVPDFAMTVMRLMARRLRAMNARAAPPLPESFPIAPRSA
jgi:CRP/FNR family cyclic AMP-dependent transcriptional regulator